MHIHPAHSWSRLGLEPATCAHTHTHTGVQTPDRQTDTTHPNFVHVCVHRWCPVRARLRAVHAAQGHLPGVGELLCNCLASNFPDLRAAGL
eukprot:297393-Pelagomonas_calceolata.AAC.5